LDPGRASAEHVAVRAGHRSAGLALDRYDYPFPDGEDALTDQPDATINKANRLPEPP
jgi:hypothetical protein